jgi:endonuclease/exonuclease/phosphatase family metal-dependent hydrolase
VRFPYSPILKLLFSRIRRYPGIPAALLAAALPGCIPLPKENAPLTRIEDRRSLEGDFRTDVRIAESSEPEFLDFEELAVLARDPAAGGALGDKLETFWRTPIVSNRAWKAGNFPERSRNRHLGEFLRVGTWNIEHSEHIRDVADALSSERDYVALLEPGHRDFRRDELLRQRGRLATADILLFQEMDIGVERSDYLDTPELLARKLGMNYAYAPQQIELNPVLRALQAPHPDSAGVPDPKRYRGAFGLVVLSKYPIKSAVCFPLENQPYDWYAEEIVDYDAVEELRRIGAEEFFKTPIKRQVKLGGRGFFRVDLEVPGLPDDTLSVIHVHLEIRARSEDRRRQIAEILSHIRDIPHPVVLAGDFNSSRHDLSPTSLERVIARGSRDPDVWLFGGTNLFLPAHSIYNTVRTILNEIKNLHNPLAFHNSLIFPNEPATMFEEIREFRFEDGGRFDFRGDRDRSINRSASPLANSNEKALKGYRTTYSVERPIAIFGRQRLDWIFVKSCHLDDHSDSYRLAPHFGETLIAFDRPQMRRLSDHRPCVVDLPLDEPNLSPAE